MKWLGRWFWSPIKPGENSAQTLVRVLGNLFRDALSLVILIVVVGGVLLGITSARSSADYAERETERAKLVVTVTRVEPKDTSADVRQLFDALRSADAAGNVAEARRLAAIIRDMQRDPQKVAQLCLPEFPLSVYIENNTSQALKSMTIELVARKRGSSTNELSYSEQNIEWDKIIPPGYAMSLCYGVSAEHSGLQFSGSAREYSVNLVPVEDWMLKETQAWKTATH